MHSPPWPHPPARRRPGRRWTLCEGTRTLRPNVRARACTQGRPRRRAPEVRVGALLLFPLSLARCGGAGNGDWLPRRAFAPFPVACWRFTHRPPCPLFPAPASDGNTAEALKLLEELKKAKVSGRERGKGLGVVPIVVAGVSAGPRVRRRGSPKSSTMQQLQGLCTMAARMCRRCLTNWAPFSSERQRIPLSLPQWAACPRARFLHQCLFACLRLHVCAGRGRRARRARPQRIWMFLALCTTRPSSSTTKRQAVMSCVRVCIMISGRGA